MVSLLLAVFPVPINHWTPVGQAQLFASTHPLAVLVIIPKPTPDARIPQCFFFSFPLLQFTRWLLHREGPVFPPTLMTVVGWEP